MIKFLHTSDLQIGMAAPGVGLLAKQIQDVRVESLKTVLQLAVKERVNFVLIAGDLFETNQISKKNIQQVARLLEQAKPLSVYILPGNHDYYGPSSMYIQKEFLNLGKHIHVFSEKKPMVVPDLNLTLYPSPCFETRSNKSPLEGMQKQVGTKYHIAIVHGSISASFGGTESEDDYFPVTEGELKNLNMDYIALGHWHSLHPDPQQEPNSLFYYSGTPEPTGFGERQSGYTLLVELNEGKHTVTKIPTGQFHFVDIKREIKNLNDVNSLKSEIMILSQPEKVLVRLILSGVISIATLESIEKLIAESQGHFAFVRCEQDGLLIEPNDSDLSQFTKGGIGYTTFTLLKSKRDASPASERIKYERAISLAYKVFKGTLE